MSIAAPSADLWLHSRRYDMGWFLAVPIGLAALLLGLAAVLGPTRAVTIYMVSSLLTGLPHNWITWLMLMPRQSRSYYQPGTLLGPFVWAALVMVPVVLFFGTPLFAWALTITITIATFHITRQHQGILHVCDARYLQATGDAGIRPWSAQLRWLIGSVALTGFCWKLVGPPLALGIVGAPMQFQLYPLPLAGPIAASLVTAYLAFRVVAGAVVRHRAGARFPLVHAIVGGTALGNIIVATLVPNEAFFVTLAIVASYHNLQYFAFCYTHHHLRAVADPVPNDVFTRWARERRWAPWFGLPLALGVAFGLAITALPPYWTAVLGYWFMTSHYFVDGHMWRRKYYPLMGRFASGRVAPTAAPLSEPVPTH